MKIKDNCKKGREEQQLKPRELKVFFEEYCPQSFEKQITTLEEEINKNKKKAERARFRVENKLSSIIKTNKIKSTSFLYKKTT